MNKRLKMSIIGLGYVGLPLFVEFSKKFNVVGFDESINKINLLLKNKDYTNQISNKDYKIFSKNKISFKSSIFRRL